VDAVRPIGEETNGGASVVSELKVRCKACGEGFRVPGRQDEATSRVTPHLLAGKAYQCSKCGQKRVYDEMDHFFA
jgi:uncharacterized protein (DUF983 family)